MKGLEKEHKIIIARCVSAALLLGAVWSIGEFSDIESFWIKLLIFILSYLLVGYDVVLKALKNISHGEIFDECFLMVIATVGAFCIGEYPEAVAVMLFYQVGELCQDIAVDKSRDSIRSLLDLKPDKAVVIRENEEIEVAPEEVKVGETIIVRAGERIPLDGEITEGSTTLNTSALTGESMPRDAEVGSKVMNGTINLTAVVKIKVSAEYCNSTVAKIIELTENAAERKAKTESFIKRFARVYTPCVVIGALLLAVVPPFYFDASWSEWINRALVFLVVSCPCALVISVPLSFFSGIGAAAKEGILIKGASGIEDLAEAKVFVFDKTGTLTKGEFSVSNILPCGIDEKELLEIAAYAECYSEHPIARSICDAYGNDIDKTKIGEVKEIAGKGISTVINGKTVLAGNSKLVSLPDGFSIGEAVGTVVYISVDGDFKGCIIIADEVKSDAKDAISALKKCGIEKTVMLTGDNEAIASSIGKKVGIDVVHASLLPIQKLEYIKSLSQKTEGKVAFVGDGINDAPAIAESDIGIAMGFAGSDAAIDTADLVIMDDKPQKVARAMKIAKRTMNIAKQNIAFSLIVKGAVLITGALGLSGMWLAVFADVGVTVIAVLNATRMLYKK